MTRLAAKTANRNGIPVAFLVNRQGRIAWIGHLMALDEDLLELLTSSSSCGRCSHRTHCRLITAGFVTGARSPMRPEIAGISPYSMRKVVSVVKGETYQIQIGTGWDGTLRITRNLPPAIRLISPLEGDSYTSPARVRLLAEAEDPEGEILEVSFFLDGRLAARVSQPPCEHLFSFAGWEETPSSAFATITDSAGLVSGTQEVYYEGTDLHNLVPVSTQVNEHVLTPGSWRGNCVRPRNGAGRWTASA
jgi:hypothetical protein